MVVQTRPEAGALGDAILHADFSWSVSLFITSGRKPARVRDAAQPGARAFPDTGG